MRLSRPATRHASTLDERIMPLINVVFLLLIFFLVAGVIRAPEPFEMTPPEAEVEASIEADMLTVYLAADGRLALGETVVPDEAALVRGLSAAASEPAETPLRLMADRDAEAVEFVALMEALGEADFERLSLVTRAGGGQ